MLSDRVFGDGGQAGVAGDVRLVDEGAQFAGDLGLRVRVRAGLGGVLDVAQQMRCAQLVDDAVEVVIVDVPVVHDDGAVQVAVDEVPERGQVPAAEEVIGEQAVQATCRYIFLLSVRSARTGVSSPQITRAATISDRITLPAAATAFAARPSRACTHPSEGRVPDIDSMMSAHR